MVDKKIECMDVLVEQEYRALHEFEQRTEQLAAFSESVKRILAEKDRITHLLPVIDDKSTVRIVGGNSGQLMGIELLEKSISTLETDALVTRRIDDMHNDIADINTAVEQLVQDLPKIF